jgi:hypothetical protein
LILFKILPSFRGRGEKETQEAQEERRKGRQEEAEE